MFPPLFVKIVRNKPSIKSNNKVIRYQNKILAHRPFIAEGLKTVFFFSHQHPGYKSIGIQTAFATKSEWSDFFDFALLKLVNPVTLSQTVNLVCLPTEHEDENLTDTPITVTGWGRTGSSLSKFSSVLKSAKLRYVSPEICSGIWSKWHMLVDNKIQLCAHQPNKRAGICDGDSGGKTC
jgi:hypothetical protein